MQPWIIVTAVTVGYLMVSLAVGLYSGRSASKGPEGYIAGDRTLGFLVLYFIMGASIFSAFAFLGGPGWAYSRGAAAFYILSYGTIGLIPWYAYGPRVAALGRRFGYVTQAELFAHRFKSRWLSAALAVITLVAFIPYLTLQMQGAGYVFNVVTAPWAVGVTLLNGVWCAEVRLGKPTIESVLQARERRGLTEDDLEEEFGVFEDFDPQRPPLFIEPDGTSEWATFVVTQAPRDMDFDELVDEPQIEVIVDGPMGLAWLQRPFYDEELDLFEENGWPAVFRRDFLDPRMLTEDDVLEVLPFPAE